MSSPAPSNSVSSTLVLRDHWHGLRAPTRGTPLTPRPFPALVRSATLTRPALAEATRSGAWEVVRRGILARSPAASLPRTEQVIHRAMARAAAAAECARGTVAVSHLTAAMALGCWIYSPPSAAHVSHPYRVGHGTGDPRVTRHACVLREEDLRLASLVVVTCAARTALDVALTEPFLRALPVVDAILRLGVDRDDLLARLESRGRTPGLRTARAVVAAATGRVHALGESLVRGHAALIGLPPPHTLYLIATRLGDFEADVAWPEIKVAIEIDGAVKLAGLTGEALTRSVNRAAAREAALVAAGWVILHLTWSDICDAAGLRRALVRLVRHRVI